MNRHLVLSIRAETLPIMDIDEDDDFYGNDEPEAPPAQPASAAAPTAPAAPPKADAADELEEGEEEDEGGAMDEDDDSVDTPRP